MSYIVLSTGKENYFVYRRFANKDDATHWQHANIFDKLYEDYYHEKPEGHLVEDKPEAKELTLSLLRRYAPIVYWRPDGGIKSPSVFANRVYETNEHQQYSQGYAELFHSYVPF